jgi:hypothetical protein
VYRHRLCHQELRSAPCEICLWEGTQHQANGCRRWGWTSQEPQEHVAGVLGKAGAASVDLSWQHHPNCTAALLHCLFVFCRWRSRNQKYPCHQVLIHAGSTIHHTCRPNKADRGASATAASCLPLNGLAVMTCRLHKHEQRATPVRCCIPFAARYSERVMA